ncbi:MAG: putative porin [Verrucomicrobia bacterium]|nr:putative porin [Verrucomicrobiota bacterium]
MTNRDRLLRRQVLLVVLMWCASTFPGIAADPASSPSSQNSSGSDSKTGPTPAVSPNLNPTLTPSPLPAASPNPAATPVVSPSPAPSPTPMDVASGSSTGQATPTPSQNAVINLINRLVQRGVLTKEDATELIQQAEADTARAKEEAAKAASNAAAGSELTQSSLLPPVGELKNATAVTQAAPEPTPPLEEIPPALQPGPDNTVRVTYIPEIVKNQLREQIEQDVLRDARRVDDKLGPEPLIPGWVNRITPFGDIRLRYELNNFPGGNDNTGAFPNFNAINTGSPFDTAGTSFPPEYNVDKDRERFRFRVRVGLNADLGDGFSIGIRGATGENDSPVTENQTLGNANNAQGGNFQKYSIWLDRAFLKWEAGGLPERDLTITLGRMDNPFFSTTLIWANDLGFDGAAISGRYQVVRGVTPFLTAGAFPVYNTDFNFANTNPAKFDSTDKYLYAVQGGTDWNINRDFHLKIAGALYDFNHIEGRLSNPFVPLTSTDQGNTDDLRPAFAQNGNTYMALRNILPTAANNFGQIDQFQYYGLATPFHEVAVTGRLDYNHFEPFQVSVTGEWVTNTAFDRGSIAAIAVNNRSTAASGSVGRYIGGNSAWNVYATLGSPVLQKRWDWNLGIGYRYVESDSVVDGFNDSDFGAPLYGTNLKGYTIFGNLALTPAVYVGFHYYSANAIAGPPFKSDVFQFDIGGKF